MGLSNDLISQFVKATKDTPKQSKETTAYGTVKIASDGKEYVQLDGSSVLTPTSSTVGVKEGDRVIVMIKNHTATITGNLDDRAARTGIITDQTDTITRVDTLLADEIDARKAAVEELRADDATIRGYLFANNAQFDSFTAKKATIYGLLTATEALIDTLKASVLNVEIANIKYANIAEALEATHAKVYNLEVTYGEFHDLVTENLESVNSTIENLGVTYANIDFSNIGQAAMEYFYANSGLIENVVVGNGSITGILVGVTIKGDIIEGGTIVADKLVIQGEDGLYYKLNTDGATTEAEQTEYNSLNGSVITAKTITATQISVNDLVAFDATIGGFNITENSIYSEVKDSEGNTTRGIYMDTDGQINFGDSNNFIKYYKAEDGTYKLVVSASDILYALNGKQHSLSDIGSIGEYVRVGTHEGEPCIELGENDSDFKLVITNTRILFMEGSAVPAYINNQSLHITKAVIEEEIQQGEFVWKVRANGNMGLMWKGGS